MRPNKFAKPQFLAGHIAAGIAALGASAGLGGCIPVQLQAPDKPIEINLNVNIRQEVIVRLEGDARNLLENNPDIF
jgi:hypothetical protein